MSERMTSSPRWTAFRVALGVSALWLVGYAVYRYAFHEPPQLGTLYGTIFPAALLLSATGLALAFRPALLGPRQDAGAMGFKIGITGLGMVWMATGVHCTLSLLSGVAAAPLGGTVDLVHMLSDHVFLPAAVSALAWAPEVVAARLGAALEVAALADEGDLPVGGAAGA